MRSGILFIQRKILAEKYGDNITNVTVEPAQSFKPEYSEGGVKQEHYVRCEGLPN